MNLKRFLQQLFHRPSAHSRSAPAGMQAAQSEMMEKLVMMLDQTQSAELGCDEVFALLDQFAEMAARGENVAQLMPLVKQHLEMCADCREEYQVLKTILENTAPGLA